MWNFRTTRRRHRFDAAAPRVPRSAARRLALESLESRALLSGTQIDDAIFNLDPFQDYAIISYQGETQSTDASPATPAPAPGTSATLGNDSSGAGVSTPLPTRPTLSSGAEYVFSRDQEAAGLPPSPWFHSVWPTDLFGAPGLDPWTMRAVESGFTGAGVTIVVIGVGDVPIQFPDIGSDVRSSLDDLSAGGVFTSNSASLLVGSLVGTNPNLSFRDVQEILVRSSERLSSPSFDLAAAENFDRGRDFSLAFTEARYEIFNPSWSADGGGQHVAYNDAIASTRLFEVYANYGGEFLDGAVVHVGQSVPLTATESIVGSVIHADSAIWPHNSSTAKSSEVQVRVAPVGQWPGTRSFEGASQPESDAKLAEAIAELLTEGVLFVYQATSTASSGTAAGANPGEVATESADSSGSTPAVASFTSNSTTGANEGGMIAIEALVGEIPATSTRAVAHSFVAESASELVGEMSRVAVMELIEGEADPVAPGAVSGQFTLLAAIGPDETVPASDDPVHAAVRSAVHALARQAGPVTALASPLHLAAIAGSAGDALGAAALARFAALPTEDARSTAFAQWSEATPDNAAIVSDDASRPGLNAGPLLIVLACDRLAAAKKNRQQREAGRQPARASHLREPAC